jgi:arginine exporter protein ArgO
MEPGAQLTPVLIPLLDGLIIGLSLIVMVGPQGLFVLRQGLARQHLHVICLLCSVSDVVLIGSSISGTLVLSELPWLYRRRSRWRARRFCFGTALAGSVRQRRRRHCRRLEGRAGRGARRRSPALP